VIALKLTGEGEIFYLQKRIGFKNQYFNIIKFATMLKNSMNMGTGSITLRNDPRVTWVGKYLRKSKLNELPQLWNVVRGDMSLVGPRPLVDKTFQAYPEDIRYRVYDSRPGITGIGSIVFRDEEEMISKATIPPHEFYEQVIAPYKGALEMWYQENKSFWTDFKILFLTVWVILFPKSRLMYQWLPNLPQKQS
jgi:lipopolysaccharide/colanic/teichoic acid biosynthesis glycosyltransferase